MRIFPYIHFRIAIMNRVSLLSTLIICWVEFDGGFRRTCVSRMHLITIVCVASEQRMRAIAAYIYKYKDILHTSIH